MRNNYLSVFKFTIESLMYYYQVEIIRDTNNLLDFYSVASYTRKHTKAALESV
jgi:hypothetical protein